VQHIALATPSIVTAVEGMAARGVRFLDMPSSYYEDARHRCGQFELDWTTLEHLGVEVDHDGGGYLLQIFTEMISDRPTVFW
jgi:4-hydroxyphenylpyruvate dioxygenase